MTDTRKDPPSEQSAWPPGTFMGGGTAAQPEQSAGEETVPGSGHDPIDRAHDRSEQFVRPRYIEGRWYVPVGDLHEALDALGALYDSLPRYSCKSDTPDGCPVCVARELLKASNRK